MIARAASAVLAILAGSLVTALASAEPPPPAPPQAASAPPIAPPPPLDAPPADAPPLDAPPLDAPPLDAPPADAPPLDASPRYASPGYAPPGYAPPWYAPPGYAPPGYAPPFMYMPWPMIWRDGAWHRAGEVLESLPPPPARDPMFTTGIVIGVTGLLTTALGAGLFANAGSAQTTCGLSGCIDLPSQQYRIDSASVIAGGVSAALFGGVLAFAGARGSTPWRRSQARTMTGLVFTSLGVSVASSGLVQALAPARRGGILGEVFPQGYSGQTAYVGATPAVLALLAMTCFAVGVPLWISGARTRARPKDARAAASALDLLPSVGGAALRWTR